MAKQTPEQAKKVNSFSVRKIAFLGRSARTLHKATVITSTYIESPETRAIAFSTLQRTRNALITANRYLAELDEVPYTKVPHERAREALSFVREELKDVVSLLEDRLWPGQAIQLDANQDLETLMASTESSEK